MFAVLKIKRTFVCLNKNLGNNAGVAQLVERQPSKLNVAGSNPVSRSNISELFASELALEDW